jgi:hypothetical protein
MAVVATIAKPKSGKGPAAPGIASVYRTLDGAIHHTRCRGRMTYHGVSAGGLELTFHCAICHERLTLPEIVAANLPVVTTGAA